MNREVFLEHFLSFFEKKESFSLNPPPEQLLSTIKFEHGVLCYLDRASHELFRAKYKEQQCSSPSFFFDFHEISGLPRGEGQQIILQRQFSSSPAVLLLDNLQELTDPSLCLSVRSLVKSLSSKSSLIPFLFGLWVDPNPSTPSVAPLSSSLVPSLGLKASFSINNLSSSLPTTVIKEAQPSEDYFTDSQIFHTVSTNLLPLLSISTPAILRPSGLLVSGGIGSGKTAFVRWLASQLPDYSLFSVPSADLIHKEVGASERAVSEIFSSAISKAPAIVLLENFDIVFGTEKSLSRVFGRVQSVLLAEMSEAGRRNSTAPPVITIMTVSNSEYLDQSFLISGRLEETIAIPSLTRQEKRSLLSYLLRKMEIPENTPQDIWEEVLTRFEEYSLGLIVAKVNECLYSLRSREIGRPMDSSVLIEEILSNIKRSIVDL